MTKKLVDGIFVDMTQEEEAELAATQAEFNESSTLIKYAKDLHWQKVTGGFLFNGIPIKTDDVSRGFITAARLAANSDPQWTTKWRAADGKRYPVDAQTMIAMSDAIEQYINGLFVLCDDIEDQIEAGTLKTRGDVLAAFG